MFKNNEPESKANFSYIPLFVTKFNLNNYKTVITFE